MTNNITIKIEDLIVKYPNNTKPTLKKINLEVYEGEIFGYIGRNGVGKSTTIKSIMGLLPIESGNIIINDFSIKTDPLNAKQNIGYVSDNHSLYENMTGREFINFICDCFKTNDRTKIDELVNIFDINNAIDNLISSYSHGMKQKISIISSLVHNPKVWLLDEPLTGLDIKMIKEVKEAMIFHKNNNNTVFFSSHNLDIVEKICDRVAIINDGEIKEVIDVLEFQKNNPNVSLTDYFYKIACGDENV